MVKYILLALLIPAVALGVELDADNNGAVDIDKGGTNAQTAAGVRSAINVEDGAEANEPLVSQAVAEAGTSETEYSWSPLRVFQSIGAWITANTTGWDKDASDDFDGSYTSLSSLPLTFVPATHGNESHSSTFLDTETDPVFALWISTFDPFDAGDVPGAETDPDFNAWLLATPPIYSETDPVFALWDKSTGISITESQISDFGTYLTAESDPTVDTSAEIQAIIGAGVYQPAGSYLTSLTGAVLTDQTTSQTIGTTDNRLAMCWATDLTVTNAINGSVTGNAGTVTNGVYTGDAGTVFLSPTGDGSGLTGVLKTEVDGSTTNEIQTIDTAQLSGTKLQLSLSSDGEAVKEVELSGFQDAPETAATIEDIMTGADAITTPADADTMSIVVSAVLKKVTWANIEATLKTYFDGIYQDEDADLTDLADGELTASKVGGVKDADYGDVNVSSGVWTVQGYEPAGITASDISDKNAGTDITADLEEESHAAEHTVSASDTVFPTDPNADKYLMWDDDPGALVWATVSGGLPPDSDYGDVTISSGVWAVEDDSHAHTTTTISGIDIGDDTNLAGTANEITLTGDTLSLATVIDLGGKTSLEVPNAADPTTDAAGEIAVDSSAAPGSGLRFYGDAAYTLAGTYSKSFVILNPVATDDYPIWCTPYAITIKHVRVQCIGGTNIVGQLTECDGEGINAAVVDSSDITATANNSVDDDGTLSNPSIDAGDYVGWKTESISGSPTSVTVTFDYTINQVN